MITMDDFEDLLNESNPMTVLGRHNFYAGTILRKCDPAAFAIEYHAYCAAVEEEMEAE
jgi:hypothetical protein